MTQPLRENDPLNQGYGCGLHLAQLHFDQIRSNTQSNPSATVAREGCFGAYAQPSQCVYNTGGCAPHPNHRPKFTQLTRGRR